MLFKDACDVELVFRNSAINEIAHQAYIRKTGARGLNAIVENVMQELLLEVPLDSTIRRCVVTKDAVLGLEKPRMLRQDNLVTRNAS